MPSKLLALVSLKIKHEDLILVCSQSTIYAHILCDSASDGAVLFSCLLKCILNKTRRT